VIFGSALFASVNCQSVTRDICCGELTAVLSGTAFIVVADVAILDGLERLDGPESGVAEKSK
jgi:hypothetical protein